MAKPLGKGSADLPEKDVSNDGVTTDKDGNVQVDPNAPINDPSVKTAIAQREQTLVQKAAKQHVADTVQSSADDAQQAFSDAQNDHREAQSALSEAKANAKTDTDYEGSQKKLADAQATADQKQAALIAAGHALAAKKDTAKKAAADPLGYTAWRGRRRRCW